MGFFDAFKSTISSRRLWPKPPFSYTRGRGSYEHADKSN